MFITLYFSIISSGFIQINLDVQKTSIRKKAQFAKTQGKSAPISCCLTTPNLKGKLCNLQLQHF